MAVVKCAICGKMVSDKELRCPHCDNVVELRSRCPVCDSADTTLISAPAEGEKRRFFGKKEKYVCNKCSYKFTVK